MLDKDNPYDLEMFIKLMCKNIINEDLRHLAQQNLKSKKLDEDSFVSENIDCEKDDEEFYNEFDTRLGDLYDLTTEILA